MSQSFNKLFDVVVVGAGVNGLVAAAYLGKQGKKVLCVERNDWLGGVSARFHASTKVLEPGWQLGAVRISRAIIDDLKLQEHGLKLTNKYSVEYVAAKEGGSKTFTRWIGDDERTASEIAKIHAADGRRYVNFMKELRKFAPVVRELALNGGGSVFPHSAGQPQSKSLWDVLRLAARVRGMGAKDMYELMRVIPLSASDWLAESFQDDFIKASLASRAAFDNYAGPMGPGTAFQLILAECLDDPVVEAGAPALVKALVRSCEQHGVAFRTSTQVSNLVIEEGRVTKVALSQQEDILCERVYATVHPRELFYNLLEPAYLSLRHEEAVRVWRSRGVTAVARFKVHPSTINSEHIYKVLIPNGHLHGVEKAFDAVKYQQAALAPVIEIEARQAEVLEHGTGQPVAVVTAFFHGVSTDLDAPAERERLSQLAAHHIAEQFATSVDLKDIELYLPVDIAKQFHSPGGHLWQGETAIDQIVVRPHPDFCGYHTPVGGLYLCGRSSQGGTALGWPAMKAALD